MTRRDRFASLAESAAPEDRQTAPSVRYQVAMPQPASHLFEVTLEVLDWQPSGLTLAMPVWTPGSYLVREYARHVRALSATNSDGEPLACRKVSKNRWQVDTTAATDITVRYQVYANELTVRTNHLDATHGYFNGAALFCLPLGCEQQPVRVAIRPPHPNWHVTTALPAVADQAHTFEAPDFDALADSPFEIGTHPVYAFEVWGKPHQLAIWGQGNADPHPIIADTQAIVAAEAELYGELPYDRYVFLLHQSSSGFGGLEHRASCSLNYPRWGFRDRDKYERFLQLVAHEFFHLWNVKRIRPQALETIDYERENYTSLLWFFEGVTTYYDSLIPQRAGCYGARSVLETLGKDITRLLKTPGRRVQPLSDASFDAWIKLYRRDANSDNEQVSYYLKGELVALLLDLLIRARHDNARSLDDLMRRLWQRFGRADTGLTPPQLQAELEAVAGTDLSAFWQRYIDGTEALPFDGYLAPFGLQVSAADEQEPPPYLGLSVKPDGDRAQIGFVDAESPAGRAGIDAGDELLALDGWRVSAEQLEQRLHDYQPGDTVAVSIFHQDALQTHSLTLAPPQPGRYAIVPLAAPSAEQAQRFRGWLGEELAALQ